MVANKYRWRAKTLPPVVTASDYSLHFARFDPMMVAWTPRLLCVLRRRKTCG
jgi:hypothetical protein